MSSNAKPSDPRTAWRWMYRIARVAPSWIMALGGSLARLGFRLSWPFARRRQPQHLGLYLWTGSTNADLYETRLIAALDLVNQTAPVYLRWLRGTFQVLWVDQLIRIMSDGLRPDYWLRMLALNPYIVWHASTEQLALYVVAEAASGRLKRGFRRTRRLRIRGAFRGLTEMVACARLPPGGAALAAEWEQRLREYERQWAWAAA